MAPPRARKIAILSTTRADLWPLSPVIQALAHDPRADCILLLGGTHDPASFRIGDLDIPAQDLQLGWIGSTPATDSPEDLTALLAATATSVSHALSRNHPDILVLLGDRYELLGAAGACLLQRTPIAHLHGGELTLGAIDDSVRHALTKLAHLHFCAAEPYASRVRAMGEESWRVHMTGAPSLDRLLRDAELYSRLEVEELLGHELVPPVGLLTYHPPTNHPERLVRELDALIGACSALRTVIATHPGADPGYEPILRELRSWELANPNVILVPSLGRYYPAVMSLADVVIGNSSSGIVEAPLLRVPTVNVGDRQEGRLRATSIIDVDGDISEIRSAISRALDPSFRDALATSTSLYGDGGATPRILQVLLECDLARLLDKRFVDDPFTEMPWTT